MIFVDSWAWIALALKLDQYHRAAKAQHKVLQRSKRKYVTTDFVLSEVITHLYHVLTSVQAQGYINTLLNNVDAGTFLLVSISPSQFRLAWQMRQTYHDKPDISFVDLTSMVVMQDMGLTDIFTGDAHFQQVGLGFRLVP